MQEADLLDKYKRQPFSPGLIPFTAAVRVVGTPYARIYGEEAGRQRWVISDKRTGQPAVFSHAGIFSSSDDYDTGNYVPQGQQVPVGVEAKSVQHRVNTKCLYTYILDTFSDISMYEGQWTLDEYMAGKVDGFNPEDLPRRAYLSGQEAKYRNRFWMQTPMFLRVGPHEDRAPPPSHLHPWVMRGDQGSKIFRANPDRPRVWVKVGDEILPIGDRVGLSLRRGDVVAFSFTVTYHVTSVNWFPQFHPADIVLLKPAEGDATDYSAPALDLYNRPPPSFDEGLKANDEDYAEFFQDNGPADEPIAETAAMEGIVAEETLESEDGNGRQESMEVDDAVQADGVDGELLASMERLDGEEDDGFTVVDRAVVEEEHVVDEFVDVMAKEVQRVTRGGARKRGQASVA